MKIPYEGPKFYPFPRQSEKVDMYYLVISPRYESAGTRLLGPSGLKYMQGVMSTMSSVKKPEDNYHVETNDYIYDLVKLESV